MRTKGRVDNWNDYQAKSLNRTKRQQELLRVTHENQVCAYRVYFPCHQFFNFIKQSDIESYTKFYNSELLNNMY